MSLSTYWVDAAGPRDWPSLREVTVRSTTARGCLSLAAAVAESPSPARAWRHRMAEMCGPGRLTLIARDGHGTVQALISAYVDGDLDERVTVLRHLLTTPEADAGIAAVLLDRVERWAVEQISPEVLAETEAGDLELAALLQSRGYVSSGTTRPSCAGIFDGHEHSGVATEWRRAVPRAGRSVNVPIFELAS